MLFACQSGLRKEEWYQTVLMIWQGYILDYLIYAVEIYVWISGKYTGKALMYVIVDFFPLQLIITLVLLPLLRFLPPFSIPSFLLFLQEMRSFLIYFFNRSFSPLDIYVLYQILSSTALKGCLSLNLRLKHNVFLNFTYLLITLRLCCCPWAFSSFCGEWGPLSSCNAPVSYPGGFSC